MPERRVYLDKYKINYAANSLADISTFEYTNMYHDVSRFNSNNTAVGLSFSPSGNKMYIGGLNKNLYEYNLTPGDITTSQRHQSTSFSGPFFDDKFTALAIHSSGDVIFFATYGGLDTGLNDTLGSGHLLRYSMSNWDISTLDTAQNAAGNWPSGDFLGGISINDRLLGDLSYIHDSGIARETFAIYNFSFPYSYSSYETLSFGDPVDTFSHNIGKRSYAMYSSGSYFIDQYEWHPNYEPKFESRLQINPPISGIGTNLLNNFFIDEYGENLYILGYSGVVYQYQPNTESYWRGTDDNGSTLYDLFIQNKSGDLSVSDYVDESIINSGDRWQSVASGNSYFFASTEIPYVHNISGIKLEVDHYTTNCSIDVEVFCHDTYDEGIELLASGTYPLSGLGLSTFDLNFIYSSGFELGGSLMPLYLSFDLYSPASGNHINALNLLMLGDFLSATGIDSVPLYISGGNNVNNNLDLFIDGPHPDSGYIDLFLANTFVNSGLDLFIQGHDTVSSSIPLYTLAGVSFNDVDLFLHGHDTINSGLDLYLGGHEVSNSSTTLYIGGTGTESGILPLYTIGQIPESSNSNIPLYMWATTNSGIFNTFPLHIGSEGNPDPQYNLNLYLLGQEFDSGNASLPLYIYNYNSSASGLDLFIQNDYAISSGYVPLFITTPSGAEGHIPTSGSMNLFIARDYGGIDASIPLYIYGPNGADSGISLVIEGGNSGLNETLDLYLYGAQPTNKTIQLFTKGL